MAVFNTAAHTQYASPIRAYQQGKALRANTAAVEKQTELADDKFELDKKKVELDAKKVQATVDKGLRELDKERLEATRRGAASYAGHLEENPDDVEGATQAFAYSYGPGFEEDMGQKGAIIPPEYVGAIMNSDFASAIKEDVGDRSAQKFIDANGKPVQGSMDKEGNYYDSSGVQRTDITPIAPQAGQGDISPGTDSQRGAAYYEHLDTYESASDVQELITAGLPRILELPQAVGMKGKIAMGGAGLLSTLGQEEMAEAFSEYMSGADAETVATIQVQLQAIRARIIPIVTGEQGKRLSEMEREIASRAVGLIDEIKGPGDLTKSYPQVIGALKQLYEESWATKYRTAKNDDFIQYPFDLSDKGDRIELLQEFSDAGIDMDSAKRALFRLKAIQGVQ